MRERENEKPENRINYVLKTNLPTRASETTNSNPVSALERWIPMWCPTDSCMVPRRYQGAVCDFLCQCETGRGSSLIQCVWVLLELIIFGFIFTPSHFIGALKKFNCTSFDWINHWTDFKPNLLMALV